MIIMNKMKFKKFDEEIGKFIVLQLRCIDVLPEVGYKKGHNYLLYVLTEMVKADNYIDVSLSDCIQKVANEFEQTYNTIYMNIYRVVKESKIVDLETLFKYMKKEIFIAFAETKFEEERLGEARVCIDCGLFR